jgi:hypothetical protein
MLLLFYSSLELLLVLYLRQLERPLPRLAAYDSSTPRATQMLYFGTYVRAEIVKPITKLGKRVCLRRT